MTMNRFCNILAVFLLIMFVGWTDASAQRVRKVAKIDKNWKFHLGDVENGHLSGIDDHGWRMLNVPHDWSIEGDYDHNNSTGRGGGGISLLE